MDGQVTVLPNNQNHAFDQESIVYSQSQFLRVMTDEYINDMKIGKMYIEDFYKSLQKLSVKDARSLLYIDNILIGKSWENIEYDKDDYKSLLITQLKNHPTPIERYNYLIEYKAKSRLPEAYIDWFKNDLRCSIFLTNLIAHLLTCSVILPIKVNTN